MGVLQNKVAIVTGASSGIGHAAARAFALEGACVVVTARRAEKLDALVHQISESGGRAFALAGDIRDERLSRMLVQAAVREFGGLDVAFNNAGTLGKSCPTPDVSLTEWQETLDTNLTSAFLGAKYQIPEMRRRGRGSVIFTSSFVGYRVGFPNLAAYAASKAAIIGLTQALAAEAGPQSIRVNALLPGGTDTAMADAFADSPETIAYVKGLHALKRIATPEEIARSAVYLASDDSAFTTGSAMLVDGGVSINRT